MDEEIVDEEDLGPIDLTEAGDEAVVRLLAAMYGSAIQDAELLVQWSDKIIERENSTIAEDYIRALSFVERRGDLASFCRCKCGTELLDFVGISPEKYWSRLDDAISRSHRALSAAVNTVKATESVRRSKVLEWQRRKNNQGDLFNKISL